MATKKLESPFEQFPGTLIVPQHLNAQQFNTWYERSEELDYDRGETRHDAFLAWDSRFHFILKSTLELGEGYELEQSGLKLPTPAIAVWFDEQTKHLIEEATDLKNWFGPSSDT